MLYLLNYPIEYMTSKTNIHKIALLAKKKKKVLKFLIVFFFLKKIKYLVVQALSVEFHNTD